MKKILVVDDDVDIREAARAVLESAGYQFVGASNGEEGLEKARQEKPDLIILDVMMKTFTEGFHIAHKIRRDEALKDTPIIVLSAIGEKSGFEFSPETDEDYLPVDIFIDKPFDPEDLLEKVSKLLAQK